MDVGKLLPKAISAKRRRRRQQKEEERRRRHEQHGDDDATMTSARRGSDGTFDSTDEGDGDGDGDGSFASFDSSPRLDRQTASDRIPPRPRRPASPDAPGSTSPPARPATISTHPSLIGYLTTSSPVVQATHLDSWSQLDPSGKNASPISLPNADDRTTPPPPRINTTKPAPLIVSTPPTPVDSLSFPDDKHRIADGSISPAQGMIAHRKSKSGSAAISPSKLSSVTLPPSTPSIDPSQQTPTSSTGFFSTVISAAQNAATTLGNNIPVSGMGIGSANKSKSSLSRSQTVYNPPTPSNLGPTSRIRSTDGSMDSKESAVQTLGAGELSLSQLGISEPTGSITSTQSATLADAADARSRSDSAPMDSQPRPAEPAVEESSSRPRSLLEASHDDHAPSQADSDTKGSVQRSSSMRSGAKPHRKRGSSVTTGGTTTTTVGAHSAAANSSGPPPNTAAYGAPKLTGFAIASKKRNRDFHSFFKSVPDDDYLIEDYSCALQREILAHGRLYVSEGHLCFSSNILGWTTTLVMSFDEIVSVEKRSTALVFKNGLMISTLHAKHIFASFTSRDATYDLIVNIWKLGHPTLKSTLNGVRLEGTGGDKTEKVDADPASADNEVQLASDSDDEGDEGDDDEEEDDDDDFYDEEEHDDAAETHVTDSTGAIVEPEKSSLRKASALTAPNGAPADTGRETTAPPGGSVDFPGPASHPPTDCGDSASHYDKFVGDEIIPAPLGKVYNLVFGPGSVAWMAKWLTGEQKCTDLQMEDRKGLSAENRTRNYTYVKPLNASIGPKQTKCIVSETLENIDLEKAVNLVVSVQNPDVPSGNIFSVKTRYCLSWAENNATRLQVNCTVEWTGKSWIKGPIEKGVSDGQAQYCKDLCAALRAAVTSRPRAATGASGPSKPRKKARKSKALQSGDNNTEKRDGPKHAAKQQWGPLEPVRGIIEPCIDILGPVLTGNVMYGLLVGLLVALWFGFGSGPSKNSVTYGPEMGVWSPQRLAAYEEMWRREESELWYWLEERVGLDQLMSPGSAGSRPKDSEHRSMEEKLKQEHMTEREMKEAIRVTEERLRVLQEVVSKSSLDKERGSEQASKS
ncbi:hypothetical protein CDD81_7563 [Ophiocordyceps australis]|uniref:VASt domain-containing protein n=1 Tax=Ophiocordyceps australis TaxID=1399860 RepID=A0A2C5Y4H2_9HYPO|nr:hypothetical protein CDD81_7563 [Ophiocordyceps australis]